MRYEYVYIVRASVVEDEEGMELDTVRFCSLDKDRAIQYVHDHPDQYLWVDGYELDGNKAIHVF